MKVRESLVALSLTAAALFPLAHAVQAHEGFSQYISPAGDAADHDGDRNGIGLYNRNEANKTGVKVEGTISAVSSTSITIQTKKDDPDTTTVDESKSSTFAIDTNTKILRRFRGSATVDELAVGHKVKVYGTAATDGTAKLIWDKSIWWLRLGGTITQLNDTNKTFQLMIPRRNEHGNLKTFLVMVKTNDNTVYLNSDGTTAAWTDLANDKTVRIRGSWNMVGKYLLAKRITIVLP